jgi:carbon-monoxide dehydrogenase medium subunit
MLLRNVDYLRPADIAEAVAALADHEGARPLAGGQSLINVLKHRAAEVELLVDVGRLEELRALDVRPDGSAEVGAAVTYEELEHSDELRGAHPKLAEVAAHTVDVQVRSRGTLGGNACYNDPSSNFPPLLVALGATMRVAGPGGEREVPAEEFFTGAYRTALGHGELLRSIVLPALGPGEGVGYSSVLVATDSWAIARAAALVRSNGTIEAARVVLGCVSPRPLRASAMEARLVGGEATTEAVTAAAGAATEGVDEPPSDAHASGDYRRRMSPVVAKRAVFEAIAGRG